MFAPGAMPRLPGDRRADVGQDVAEQVRRHHDVQRLRMRDHPRRERVDVVLPVLDGRVVLPHDLGDLVPQHHRVRERVRLGRAREHLPRPLRGDLEAVAENAFDAVPREDADLLRHFVRRAAMNAAADAGVLALRVLAHADHVDVRRRRDWPAASSAPPAAASAAGSRTDRTSGGCRGSGRPTPRPTRPARRARPCRARRTSPCARSRPRPSSARASGSTRSSTAGR